MNRRGRAPVRSPILAPVYSPVSSMLDAFAGGAAGGTIGRPYIAGRAAHGAEPETLTAIWEGVVSDTEGIDPESVGFQWRESPDFNGDLTEGATYTPTGYQVGKRLRVLMSYTTLTGKERQVWSYGSNPVVIDWQPPIIITAGGVYEGLNIQTGWEEGMTWEASVPAVIIATSDPVQLVRCRMRSRNKFVSIQASNADVEIVECIGTGLLPFPEQPISRFVSNTTSVARLHVRGCELAHIGGIYIDGGGSSTLQDLDIRNNRVFNIDGRHTAYWGGYTPGTPEALYQFVQLNGCRDIGDGLITNNYVRNFLGQSRVEDVINIYRSSGTATTALRIEGNIIRGAYPSEPQNGYSGGGILVDGAEGDTIANCSRYISIENNLVFGTTNHGIGVAAGRDITVSNNLVIGPNTVNSGWHQLVANNVGIYVWDVYGTVATGGMADISVTNNQVAWWADDGEDGVRNDLYLPDVTTVSGNIAFDVASEVAEQAFQGYFANLIFPEPGGTTIGAGGYPNGWVEADFTRGADDIATGPWSPGSPSASSNGGQPVFCTLETATGDSCAPGFPGSYTGNWQPGEETHMIVFLPDYAEFVNLFGWHDYGYGWVPGKSAYTTFSSNNLSLGLFHRASYVDMGMNRETALPDITGLTSLVGVYVQGNQLTNLATDDKGYAPRFPGDVPAGLTFSENGFSIGIGSNPITRLRPQDLPAHIAGLYVWDCPLLSLLPTMERFNQLRWLDFGIYRDEYAAYPVIGSRAPVPGFAFASTQLEECNFTDGGLNNAGLLAILQALYDTEDEVGWVYATGNRAMPAPNTEVQNMAALLNGRDWNVDLNGVPAIDTMWSFSTALTLTAAADTDSGISNAYLWEVWDGSLGGDPVTSTDPSPTLALVAGGALDFSFAKDYLLAVDLSGLGLSGRMPIESLDWPYEFPLQRLNLANNFLTGDVPELADDMRVVDLSNNRLSYIYDDTDAEFQYFDTSDLEVFNLGGNGLTFRAVETILERIWDDGSIPAITFDFSGENEGRMNATPSPMALNDFIPYIESGGATVLYTAPVAQVLTFDTLGSGYGVSLYGAWGLAGDSGPWLRSTSMTNGVDTVTNIGDEGTVELFASGLVGINSLTITIGCVSDVSGFYASAATLSGDLDDIDFRPWSTLEDLSLDNNFLVGGFPELPWIIYSVYLQNNNLSGVLPGGWDRYVSLNTVNIQNNGFSGQIPADLFAGGGLEYVNLSDNNFTGPLPASMAYANTLMEFRANDMIGIDGPLPPFGGIPQLQVFDIDSTSVTGEIPSLAGCLNMRIFDVQNCPLTSVAADFAVSSCIWEEFDARGCALDQASIDRIILAFHTQPYSICGQTGVVLKLQGGTNAAPSSAVATQIADMIGAGWTITTN